MTIEEQFKKTLGEWVPGRVLVSLQGWKVVGGPFWNPQGPSRGEPWTPCR